jgi:curved DNA-binding protein CbpA
MNEDLQGLLSESGDDVALYAKFSEEIQKMDQQNLYAILNVAPTATKDEIKKAYQILTKQYHPDRYGNGLAEKNKQMLGEIFTRMTDAYEILSNEKERAIYDKRIKNVKEATFMIAFEAGQRFLKSGNFAEALPKFSEARRLKPGHYESICHTAWCLYKTGGDMNETKRLLKEMLEKYPENALHYYYLGMIFKYEKNINQARLYFRKATEFDPNFTEALRELRLMNMRSAQQPGSESPTKNSFWSKMLGLVKKS